MGELPVDSGLGVGSPGHVHPRTGRAGVAEVGQGVCCLSPAASDTTMLRVTHQGVCRHQAASLGLWELVELQVGKERGDTETQLPVGKTVALLGSCPLPKAGGFSLANPG